MQVVAWSSGVCLMAGALLSLWSPHRQQKQCDCRCMTDTLEVMIQEPKSSQPVKWSSVLGWLSASQPSSAGGFEFAPMCADAMTPTPGVFQAIQSIDFNRGFPFYVRFLPL